MKLQDLYNNLRQRYWVPVVIESELGTKPLDIELFGESLVLWRSESGELSLLENRCPHRRVKLSNGTVNGERIRCFYHGWEIKTCGAFNPKTGVKSYPVKAEYGLIWAYMGTKIPEDAWLPDLRKYKDCSRHFVSAVVDTNFVDVLMNFTEGKHLLSVHSGTTGIGIKPCMKSTSFTKVSHGGMLTYAVKSSLPSMFRDKSIPVNVELDMPVSIAAVPLMGDRGKNVTIECVVPINEHQTRIIVGTLRNFTFGPFDGVFRKFLDYFNNRILQEDLDALAELVPLCEKGLLKYTHSKKYDALSERALELLS